MANDDVTAQPRSVDASNLWGRHAKVQGFWASPMATLPSGTSASGLMMLFAPVAPFIIDPGWSNVFGPTIELLY